jgi:hypothetical protein
VHCTSAAASDRRRSPGPRAAWVAVGRAGHLGTRQRAEKEQGASAGLHIQLPARAETVFHGAAVTPPRFSIVFGCLLWLSACNGVAAVPPTSPRAQQVRVEEYDPPASATALGELRVTHGQGCSFTGDRGTREGAMALLREAAAERGANFVKLTKVVEPYSGHDCYHREFKAEGLSYRLAGTAPAAVPVPVAPAPLPAASAAPLAATLAVPPATASAAGIECAPPCSPGYACESGVCRALCNPACGAGQVCRADRVCVPAAAVPATP